MWHGLKNSVLWLALGVMASFFTSPRLCGEDSPVPVLVTIGNQTTLVMAPGRVVISGIPVNVTNGGRVGRDVIPPVPVTYQIQVMPIGSGRLNGGSAAFNVSSGVNAPPNIVFSQDIVASTKAVTLKFPTEMPILGDGESIASKVWAAFPGNATLIDVAADSRTSYWLSNPLVARVNSYGVVRANGLSRDAECKVFASVEGVLSSRTVKVLANPDLDFDGIPNRWEMAYGLNPLDPTDGSSDGDGDGLSNLAEFQQGTNPLAGDTDGDAIADGIDSAPLVPESIQPTIVIQTPMNQLRVALGATITISGSITDNSVVVSKKIHIGDEVIALANPSIFTLSWVAVGVPGARIIRVEAVDAAGNLGSAQVAIDVIDGDPSLNSPPVISAGEDRFTTNAGLQFTLDSVVSDDGLPSNSVSVVWEQMSGPGAAALTAVSAYAVQVAIPPIFGDYVFRVTASDGVLTASDEVVVHSLQDIAFYTGRAVTAEGMSLAGARIVLDGWVTTETDQDGYFSATSYDPYFETLEVIIAESNHIGHLMVASRTSDAVIRLGDIVCAPGAYYLGDFPDLDENNEVLPLYHTFEYGGGWSSGSVPGPGETALFSPGLIEEYWLVSAALNENGSGQSTWIVGPGNVLRIADEGVDFPQVDRLIIGRNVRLEGGVVRFIGGSLDVPPPRIQSADPWCSDNRESSRGGKFTLIGSGTVRGAFTELTIPGIWTVEHDIIIDGNLIVMGSIIAGNGATLSAGDATVWGTMDLSGDIALEGQFSFLRDYSNYDFGTLISHNARIQLDSWSTLILNGHVQGDLEIDTVETATVEEWSDPTTGLPSTVIISGNGRLNLVGTAVRSLKVQQGVDVQIGFLPAALINNYVLRSFYKVGIFRSPCHCLGDLGQARGSISFEGDGRLQVDGTFFVVPYRLEVNGPGLSVGVCVVSPDATLQALGGIEVRGQTRMEKNSTFSGALINGGNVVLAPGSAAYFNDLKFSGLGSCVARAKSGLGFL